MGGCQASAGVAPGMMLLTPPVGLGMRMRGRWGVRSSPLLLPVSLHRKTKHLCLSWVDTHESGDRGYLCEKLGWHWRQSVLLCLCILVLDRLHRHMHGAAHLHQGSLLSCGFTKPNPRSHRFHHLSAISPHSAEATFFSPPLPLQPQRALFSVKCISPVLGTNHRELWRAAKQKSL